MAGSPKCDTLPSLSGVLEAARSPAAAIPSVPAAMKLFLLLLSCPLLSLASPSSPLLSLAQSLCPAGLEELAGAWAESPDMGCLFADGEEDQKFDTYDKALERCRSVFFHPRDAKLKKS